MKINQRTLFINGQKVDFPRKANNTEVYIVINYNDYPQLGD